MANTDNRPAWLNFSGVFLALLLVCAVLSVFFLLYFNRLIASIISYAIRTYTWHSYRIHLDIQALQVSLLGGRVFFTGLRYHGDNEAILIQNGHITWSYWLWRVRDVNLGSSKGTSGSRGDTKRLAKDEGRSRKLPCRINVKITGLEWFIYNRSPVYKNILAGMRDSVSLEEEKTEEFHEAVGSNQPRQRLQKTSRKIEEQLSKLDSKHRSPRNSSSHSNEEKATDGHVVSSPSSDGEDTTAGRDDLPLWLQLLPIHFQCAKAAVVMGNENTKGILMVKTKSLAGDIDASGCQTPDPYRQVFKIRFEHPVVEMKDNENHKDDQLTRAVKDQQAALEIGPVPHRSFFRRHRRRILGQLRNLVPYWRSSVESFSVDSRRGTAISGNQVPGYNHWQGLTRYLNDNDEDDKIRWSSVEYAAESTLVDSPEATLTIFWDVPGKVGHSHESDFSHDASQHNNNINGAAPPPAWAINLAVKGGSITYGPWADRYRAELQRVFNPTLFKDAEPAKKLPVGADRVPTQFKFYLEIDSEVTLKIPTREDSKNWRWKKEAAELGQHRSKDPQRDKGRSREKNPTTAAEKRPYGWLDVKVGPNATISFTMDMVGSVTGYTNTLSIELPSTEVSTSVNHGVLWRSGALNIVADMSFPLKWNVLRTWKFDIDSDGFELFILRDHIFLFIDLIDDWGSGPPVDYLLFTPFRYLLNLQLRNLKLYINVNDVNIINNPTDFEENTYLILSSPGLKADTCIALDRFRPSTNAVPFNVHVEALSLSLHVPPWNTQATFLTSKDLGHLESLTLDGNYHYNATTSTANTDTLVLNVSGQSPVATLHGFIIRYLLQLKDNYFGDHVHFKTLDEYQEMIRLKASNPDAEAASKPPYKKSNDLDVMLNVRIDDPKILLPANLYSAKRHIVIEGALFSADLRFTNYYMDLDLAITPLSLSLGSDDDGGGNSPMSATSSTQMFIDGLGVYGHRLFGLPPTEPTYLCNWDLSVGTITGECTAEFLTALVGGGKAFGFSLDDDENALIPYSSIVVYDVTFLRASVQSIRLWLHVEEAAFLFSTGQIDVNFNDWARTHYSKRANIKVPDLQIACVDSESAARHKTRLHSPVETNALLRTNIHFALIGRKYDFGKERQLQQELIRREDQRTHRTEFLLLPGLLEPCVPDAVDPPAQSVPPVPQPIASVDAADEKRSIWSHGSSLRSRSLRHKSSLLSSSGSNSSVLRPSSVRSAQRRREGRRKASNASGQQDSEARPLRHERAYSASTGRHSAFYSAHGDFIDRRDVSHNTVAFSSQFFAPYFPLDNVHPDSKEATMQSIEVEDEEFPETTQFGLEDIDPELFSQDSAYQSFLVELPAGVSAFLNATSLRHIASLLSALQPTNPEDILDNLQTSAMSDIFDMQKKANIQGSVLDLVVRVPHANVRFLNCSDLDSPELSQEEQDQYDVNFAKIELAARSETRNADPSAEGVEGSAQKSRVSFHFRMDSVGVSAAERFAQMDETQAAVKASIEDVVVSMGSKDVVYIDGDIGALRASSSSGKVEYLAALVHRTNALASELGTLFSTTSNSGDERIKMFTHHLMTRNPATCDPSFIVRPSAVLRAATQQLRTYDSWKLMSRMRQIWFVLSSDRKEQLKLECVASTSTYPANARQAVTKAFQNWRSWDLDHIEDAVLMNNIFGKPSDADGQPKPDQTQLMAVMRLGEAEFVLDPGPKQNLVFAVDVTARLQTHTDRSEATPESANDQKPPLTVVNLYCVRAGINLKWELLELVDDIIRLYQRTETKVAEKAPVEKPRSSPKPSLPNSIHFVLALGEGSISVETVNLKSDTISNDLKLSVLMTEKQELTDTNVVLVCDEVTTKLRSHQQALVNFHLVGPSVFVSHELQMQDMKSLHTIKTTANSQDLKLIVRQDPIVLTEVLDTVIKDELAQLCQLQKRLPTSPEPQKLSNNISERLSSFRVNLALFLNHYTIRLPLLRSLTYTISGVIARAAMAANFGKELIFDFDIKENSHDMQINVNNAPRSISLLQIPPTNGRITSHMGPDEHSVSVFASVEPVQLDASAVYSLLKALNRPEMSNTISDIQQQVRVIQEHIQEIFSSPEKARAVSPTPEGKKLVYVVHTTLAGIEIFGHAKTQSETAPLAHLKFRLDRIHLELANRLDQHGPVLEKPEVRINLRQILFDIMKGSDEAMRSCGSLSFGALITASSREAEDGSERRSFDFKSDGFEINLSADTVSTFVDVIGYLGDKIKVLDTTREIEYLQKRLRQTRPRIAINDQEEEEEAQSDIFDSFFASVMYAVEIRNIQVCWHVAPEAEEYLPGQDDLVLSVQRIEFSTKKKNTARLTIEKFQLQMVPPGQDKMQRSTNSALLPEVIFNIAFVSTLDTRRLAFQAVGKSLDLRLTSGFIVPAAGLMDSISLSAKNARQASEHWVPIVVTEKPAEKAVDTSGRRSLFGGKRLESLLIDADFAGAVVFLSSRKPIEELESLGAARGNRPALAGKYGQFSADDSGGGSTVLRTPGLAWKAEYKDDLKEDPSLYGEIKVDASRNVIYPTIVPLIMDITSSIKEVVGEQGKRTPSGASTPTSNGSGSPAKAKSAGEENILTTDPSIVLGKTKLNLGLRICRQDFTLSCQPIARVAASACFEDIYITANTVQSLEHGNFFALSGNFTKLKTAIQHVYSRESTGSFEVDEIVLSLMNSKHVSGISGLSAILKVSPMKVEINAKQLQDFLLFREIWIPREIRQGSAAPVAKSPTEPQGQFVQRYQQVAATAAFPWTATISISSLDVHMDLGQAVGKATFAISNFWMTSKKTSDWQQNLCFGFQKIGVDCNGRLSGFVAMQNFKLRTSIEWPDRVAALNETPRVQASIGFGQFRLKAAFDYQAFLVADITSIDFLMYNVRRKREGSGDRLVAFLDGDAIQIFGTTTSAAQGVALWQAIQRLIQERQANFESSLRDIEKFMKRRSITSQGAPQNISLSKPETDAASKLKSPISLDTDVVVTLKALNLGVFPSTFSDHQVFKLEALNAQARFAASMVDQGRIHSMLGLTLGQLRIGLAGVRRTSLGPGTAFMSRTDVGVDDVVASATGSRGGTILKVPKVEAVMQTWQRSDSRSIDYIFKSAFEGKVEVGWNYSRISYIRGMWANHSKTLAAAWGRELPGISAIRVTGVPEPSSTSTSTSSSPTTSGDKDKNKNSKDKKGKEQQQQQTKITAELNVPQSKYEYVALEPPVIETPQLRDMGEATPPLEWIGLHRDRLPNLTHQIVIVSLLELAGEVEDAYGRILGAS